MRNENAIAQSIREEYMERKETKVEKLVNLDKKVRMPAEVFAYTFGTVGSLVLGTGMCFAMKVIGASMSFAMPLGIVVGVIGLGMVCGNLFIYQDILSKRKKKYGKEILALSDEILNA